MRVISPAAAPVSLARTLAPGTALFGAWADPVVLDARPASGDFRPMAPTPGGVATGAGASSWTGGGPAPLVYAAPSAGAWRNGAVHHEGPAPVLLRGMLQADVLTGAGHDIVRVEDAKRGVVRTGDGSDSVYVRARANDTSGVGFLVDTGEGHDTVLFDGERGRSDARVHLGGGNDRLNIFEARSAVVDAGAGDDVVSVRLDGLYRLEGGAGADTLRLDGEALAGLTFGRQADGSVWIARAGAPANAWQGAHVSGFERVAFADGAVRAFESLFAAAAPPAAADARAASPAGDGPGLPRSPAVEAPLAGDPLAPPAREGARPNSWVRDAQAGGQAVEGTARHDEMGARGADTLRGGLGDDWYNVSHDTSVAERPGEGVDTVLYWGDKTYLLPENVENGVVRIDADPRLYGKHVQHLGYAPGPGLVGNALNNWLAGGAGDNLLDGLGGDDALTGGAGRDTFAFGRGYGRDLVRDFQPGADRVRLLDTAFDFAALRPLLSDSAAGAVLRLPTGDTLTLAGRTVAELSARDFEFATDRALLAPTFSDDFDRLSVFDGKSGDGGAWRTRAAHGTGETVADADMQWYVRNGWEGARPHTVQDGVLSLNVEYRPDLAGKLGGGRVYTSGILTTEGTFAQKYGYFEARIKMDAGAGLFPAFWMLPSDHSWPPEIDIMEQLGRAPGEVHQMQNTVPVDTTQWHTYAVEWTAERLAWFVDGKLTHTVYDHGQHKEMYLMLNVAVGGDWAGPPPAGGPGPAGTVLGSMQVDWVRAHALAPDPAASLAARAGSAPDVAFSLGTPDAEGLGRPGDTFRYLADTSGKLNFKNDDFRFATPIKSWLALTVDNSRDADSYSATVQNGWWGLNVRVRDADGGAFAFKDVANADIRLGGAKASAVTLTAAQGGTVETGSGADAVTLNGAVAWRRGDSTLFTVRTGEGDDRVTGFAAVSSGGNRMLVDAGAGRDRVTGSGGHDTLVGGAGDDVLSGGLGRDVFVFRAADGAGRDRVLDFDGAADRLRFEGVGPGRSAVQVDAHAEGALLSWAAGGSVLLVGASAALAAGWAMEFG